ncbi:MAG: septum formation protein Maf [Candidatus Marinimicrobia bacterium]|nr:septum formation protein Maf [Candidatus Neomarinimicrobiota bacterium]|tara:strand:- start:7073 stop:7651 length:579 start_codon:yes stop_codon:yes gene_type:complete
MNIILASKSKRRKDLLKRLVKDFRVIDSEFDESTINIKNPKKYCKKLAILKAQKVASMDSLSPNSIVIGADTIVSINNEILEKPSNYKEAFKMLKKLSGDVHFVYTGVSIISTLNDIHINFIEKTKVKFINLRDKDIESYILKSQPYDKSGSYGIQDPDFIFADHIVGNYENVIGLPISRIFNSLLELKAIK